jgi:hypothetical protein
MRRLIALAVAAAVVLATASVAAAQFASSSSSGPMALTSRSLQAPGSLGATANCVKHVSVDVALSWSASNFASGYTIWRANGTGGFGQVASVGSGVTSFDDTTAAYSTTYSYYVVATFHSWTATSSTASATTLDTNCK